VSLDLDGFAAVAVDDRDDSSFGTALVADGQGGSTIDHAESVGKMNKLEEIAIDGIGEDGLHNRLQVKIVIYVR
jgi:hypothetical protein